MSHAHHFLSRLDRVEAPHVELALSLYRDTDLIKYVLSQVRLPEGAERVALSLEDTRSGPFIIVTRQGQFVTVLAEGMSPGDHPVIPRGQLNGLTNKIEVLRARLALAEKLSGPTGKTTSLFGRIRDKEHRLSREEFLAISTMRPMLGSQTWLLLTEASQRLISLRGLLGHVRKAHPSNLKVLREYWKLFWICNHLMVLVSIDGREALDDLPPGISESERAITSWIGMRQGTLVSGLRALWMVAQLGKPMLHGFKKGWSEVAYTTLTLYHYGIGMGVLGLRHSKLRAEVQKALVMPPFAAIDEPSAREWLTQRAQIVIDVMQDALEHPDVGAKVFTVAAQVEFSELSKKSHWDAKFRFENAEDVPEDLACAFLSNTLLNYLDGGNDQLTLMIGAAWAAQAEAENFYMKEEWMSLAPQWTPDTSVSLLERLREHNPSHPHRAQKKPGANDPCSCGSTKKYKRCCGAVG